VPGENGVRSEQIQQRKGRKYEISKTLKLIFIGRLVTYKACDIALRGAASLLSEGRAHLSILGDGPERIRFENLTDKLGIREAVTFYGMISHSEALSMLRKSDVLVFPSLREFGGGVVFEALSMGAVPIVADHGGPGDIVINKVGYRIPLISEKNMVDQISSVLRYLETHRTHLEKLRKQGEKYAHEQLSWDAKAKMVTKILMWATGYGPKPSMPSPKKK